MRFPVGPAALLATVALGMVVVVGSIVAAELGVGPLVGAPEGTFPSAVAGLPVVTVAHAVELLQAGMLDGQVVAVAGYYNEVDPSCPEPGRYIGPLENWCRIVAFTDTRARAQLCEPYGSNGMSCHGPTGTYLAPFFVSETSGGSPWPWLTGGATGASAALVLIGHAADPRQWQCTTATQGECAHAFVVDRIAWAAGQDVPVTAPQTGDSRSGTPITPKMTLAQVAADLGLGDNLLTGAPFRAGDIAIVDPRRTLAGDNIVWLVRSLASASSSSGDETLSETVWLVDDSTGRVMDSHPLKVDAAYQPARLWQMATVHGYECCATNLTAWERVESGDGTVVYAGIVSGSASGGPDATTFGGGYGSGPLVLPAGEYSISMWLANNDRGVMGTPSDACSTPITLRPLDNVRVNADFPAGQACSFQPVPSPSLGP